MSADVIAALVAVLKADAEVAALVGTRVFGIELPRSEAGSMPRKCLVLRPSGGLTVTGGSYIEHTAQRIDVYAYGETSFEAAHLSATVALQLKRLKRRVAVGVLLHWADAAGGWISGRDPDADWPVVFQSFQVMHAQSEVAA